MEAEEAVEVAVVTIEEEAVAATEVVAVATEAAVAMAVVAMEVEHRGRHTPWVIHLRSANPRRCLRAPSARLHGPVVRLVQEALLDQPTDRHPV